MLSISVLAGFALFADNSAALHFPGLVSKDYPYDANLHVKQSYFLTAKGKSDIIQEIYKNVPMIQKKNFAPRFPAHQGPDMCLPHHMNEDIPTAESPIAGYFGSTSKVTDTAYIVPLKHGIPIKFDEEKHQDGHDKCYFLCEREWSLEEVSKFHKLVRNNYGYRLYLDDLPSATKYAGQDHYDENIPLGYVPEFEEGEDETELHPVNIFNHLDIIVTVHETSHSEKFASYKDGE